MTASAFGTVVNRQDWTEKGLRNLLEPKDLSRVRAILYGRKNEPHAAERYISVMKSAGHSISVQHCGLVVNPSCPWLGASPDRLVYDPEELGYGTVEIKCPYSLKDSDPSVVSATQFYLTIENEEPQLRRDHIYYFQVLGQMALTGCQWADFVVWSENWIAIERIRFDEQEWARAKLRLDSFFFSTVLPYFVDRRRSVAMV